MRPTTASTTDGSNNNNNNPHNNAATSSTPPPSPSSPPSPPLPVQQPITHRGVTERTALRRNTSRDLFLAFCNNRPPTADLLATFCNQQWQLPSTRFTNLVTIVAECRRRGIAISGDIKGLTREQRIISLADKPQRATPALTPAVLRIADSLWDRGLKEASVLSLLMWGAAARLTSFLRLRRDDVRDITINNNSPFSSGSITFRTGKTITATGPYTVRISAPTRAWEWLQEQTATLLFTRTPDFYYRLLGPFLRQEGIEVRSYRRGALQTLAREGQDPSDILLMSRHTDVTGLYQYLDDGLHAAWETTKQEYLSTRVWQVSSDSTPDHPTPENTTPRRGPSPTL